jgi:4-hydroxy-3-methylbut-2-en-1-yl diphosphate synthase IspG/GcpE
VNEFSFVESVTFTKGIGLYLLLVVLQDGLGDTIRVSLTEPPEEEIDPCQRLANLGAQAANLQIGVVMHFLLCALSSYSVIIQ